MPVKAHEWENGVPGDAGYDVKVLSVETERIDPAPGCRTGWVRVKLDTGVHMQPPVGYRIMAVPNSRVTKTGFVMPNSPGTIDANYRGSIKFIYLYPFTAYDKLEDAPATPQRTAGMVSLCNMSITSGRSEYATAEAFTRTFWTPGTVCGQLIVVPDYDSALQVCDSLDETSRGAGGFGSSEARATEQDAGTANGGVCDEAALDRYYVTEHGDEYRVHDRTKACTQYVASFKKCVDSAYGYAVSMVLRLNK